MAKATVAELEVLFTADTKGVDKGVQAVKAAGSKIEGKPIKAEVDADVKGALAGMERVESEAKKLVSEKTMTTVDANIERAEKNLARTQERLDYLRSVETDLEVSADVKRAEASLERTQRQVDALTSARAKMEVVADTSRAESELEGLADTAEDAGLEGGQRAGAGLESTLEAALTAIPVAGGIILAAAAIGKAIVGGIQDGMSLEVGVDRLQALTGLDEVQARTVANAAGEAYASTFGESIEANMDTARLALQFDLIDEDESVRDSQKVIEGLAGIADVLGEDVQPVAQAVTTMLRTGIVDTAEEAFDVLATGAREGVNAAEDLLDTFVEYPALFARLGLDAEEALGLLNQGLEGGARNSDLVADALKEFQIRATDASDTSAEGFAAIGLSAEEMTKKIAAGGDGAKEGLGQVLDGLRNLEDPVARNIAGVALFGTQWEDMGAAMGSLDLSTAVASLDGVTGAAQQMFDTLSDNDATKMEEAKRNIEVATDGIKGAMAAAFSEPLGDLAEWVSSNRGPLLKFFQDLVNGAIDFAQAANTGFGDFVSGPLATMIDGLSQAIKFINPLADTSALDTLKASMEGFSGTTQSANEKLEGMRGQFNEFADGQVALGYVHDAAMRTASAIDEVGVAADGSVVSLDEATRANLDGSAAGKQLESQIRAAMSALDEETEAASAAGEGQADLAARYDTTTGALQEQLVKMGFTKEEAQRLIATYGQIPGDKSTAISAPGAETSKERVDRMTQAIRNLPAEKRSEIQALLDSGDVDAAERRLNYLSRARTAKVKVVQEQVNRALSSAVSIFNGQGNLLTPMATGGLSPMANLATMVPPNTWRVVGDRSDVDELYAPLDGSARSWALLMEGLRRMPGSPPVQMSDGGVVGAATRKSHQRSSGVTYRIGQVSIAAPDWVRDVEQMKAWFETVNLAFHRA